MSNPDLLDLINLWLQKEYPKGNYIKSNFRINSFPYDSFKRYALVLYDPKDTYIEVRNQADYKHHEEWTQVAAADPDLFVKLKKILDNWLTGWYY